MNKPNTQAAKTLGAIAYSKGMHCAPALDSAFAKMIEGRQVGDKRTAAEAKAWLAGWMQANLAAA